MGIFDTIKTKTNEIVKKELIDPFDKESKDYLFRGEIKRKKISQRDRNKIWDDEFGHTVDRAMCPICERNEVRRHQFALGHINSLFKGGPDELSNMRPICFQCNTEMGTMDMNEYIAKYHPIHFTMEIENLNHDKKNND